MIPHEFYPITVAQLAYARCLDEGRLEEWPGFFVGDGKYVITTDRNHRQGLEVGVIWADSRAMLEDRVSSLRKANIYEPHRYRHILGQPFILERNERAGGETEVASETSFVVIRVTEDGPMDVFAAGRYLDRYAINGHGAMLKERIVVCDSSHFDTLLAIPL